MNKVIPNSYDFTIQLKGHLRSFKKPLVMGIINVTPDSFYAPARAGKNLNDLAEKMLKEGADILDIGAVSSRPGADDVDEKEERKRLIPSLKMLTKTFPSAIISVDTFRSEIAKEAADEGAAMINDISAGLSDSAMLATVAQLHLPYILMHRQGDPKTMQLNPVYKNVVTEVIDFLALRANEAKMAGIHDILIDPGFGFGKTISHNLQLLHHMDLMTKILPYPLLAGLSRKSFIGKITQNSSEGALNGTTALHMVALLNGASLLRVHDVKEAQECVSLFTALNALNHN